MGSSHGKHSEKSGMSRGALCAACSSRREVEAAVTVLHSGRCRSHGRGFEFPPHVGKLQPNAVDGLNSVASRHRAAGVVGRVVARCSSSPTAMVLGSVLPQQALAPVQVAGLSMSSPSFFSQGRRALDFAKRPPAGFHRSSSDSSTRESVLNASNSK